MQTLLPHRCVLCAEPAGRRLLCDPCAADLPWHDATCCPMCALPSPAGAVCGACLRQAPAFDATRALLQYRFPVDALLQRYKYSGLLAVAELAGLLLAEALQDAPKPDVIIPMPLHPSRLKERGFNQSLEIARVVSARLGIPLAAQACTRTRPTLPQAGLTPQERVRNLRGVFACSQSFVGRRVVLLDDVMTTGASLSALARTVRDAGAAGVECWVVARTLKDQ